MAGEMILHSDLNCFYASVEMNENPYLRGKAIAVCGSTEDRHGIVLTASYPAKRMGVKTGAANWQARQCCPGLICVPPHYELYLKYSKLVRRIYARYTDDIEPFGMDENWLAIPYGRGDVEREGRMIAEEIRRSVREEIGLTVSIGVSFSKIFAKLGSDMKKPDAVTVISRANFQGKVWPLAVSELLYVGPATTRRLMSMNVMTIGDLAKADPELIRSRLGKNGVMLWRFANGADHSPVMPAEFVPPIKSVGHGTTCVCDLEAEYPVWLVLYELAQDVGHVKPIWLLSKNIFKTRPWWPSTLKPRHCCNIGTILGRRWMRTGRALWEFLSPWPREVPSISRWSISTAAMPIPIK